ncbi:T9SS type A sorting domain-containing protein [Hymenobacter terrenus]|uniref:T9SS type A sorting domain-containing protein n=1 Tax=Hymenobacter terrenus TaxID=1629124 RepID=UPI0018CD4163|nr:T9SS type A sorting domain-containing protein [Hymenobacter terrenus]
MLSFCYENARQLAARLRRQASLLTTVAALLYAPAVRAQVTVPSGNPPTNPTAPAFTRQPLSCYAGFERSAMIYTAAEFGSRGSFTFNSIGFYLESVQNPYTTPAKIYLKATSATEFMTATTVADEEAGATLVYDGLVPSNLTVYSWLTIPLSTPFTYDGTSNLEVIVETNAGLSFENILAKGFRGSRQVNRFQTWESDDTAPPTGLGVVSRTIRPNIQFSSTGVLSSISSALGQGQLTAFPNPGQGTVQVSIPPVAGARSATLSLFNSLGQLVRTRAVALAAPGTQAPLPLAGLASGLYTLRVQAGTETAALRLTVDQ